MRAPPSLSLFPGMSLLLITTPPFTRDCYGKGPLSIDMAGKVNSNLRLTRLIVFFDEVFKFYPEQNRWEIQRRQRANCMLASKLVTSARNTFHMCAHARVCAGMRLDHHSHIRGHTYYHNLRAGWARMQLETRYWTRCMPREF